MNNQDIIISSVGDAPRLPINLDARKLFSSDRLEMIHLRLSPGEGMEMHVQPVDVIFFILSGVGELELENRTVLAGEKSSIFVQAGLPRAWRNTSEADLCILVIKDLQ